MLLPTGPGIFAAMPKNRLLYAGIVVLVATALVWVGAELAKRIEWLLPYTAVIGIVLLVIGVAQEINHNRRAKS
ncbi:MAG: hypothetical protein PCFJNLEI_00223 [Verrucomicrobiae bacterium]|nr:hypothetical protein [Verrucomicrobiae bacterium]